MKQHKIFCPTCKKKTTYTEKEIMLDGKKYLIVRYDCCEDIYKIELHKSDKLLIRYLNRKK